MKIRTIYQQDMNKVWLDLNENANKVILSFEHDGVEFQVEFDELEAEAFRDEFESLMNTQRGEE